MLFSEVLVDGLTDQLFNVDNELLHGGLHRLCVVLAQLGNEGNRLRNEGQVVLAAGQYQSVQYLDGAHANLEKKTKSLAKDQELKY